MKWSSSIFWAMGVSALAALPACRSGIGDEDIVVSYKDNHLTHKLLAHYVPDGVSEADSARYAEQFIAQWVEDQAVMDYAMTADPDLSNRIEHKIDDYRAELIKHEYHTKLIVDSLDTEVPELEIQDYYNKNKQNFRGKENMYCYFYVVSAEDNVEAAANWIRGGTAADLQSLREWAAEHALESKLDSGYVGETKITQVSKGYYGNLQDAPMGKLIRWNGVIQGERRRYLFKMIDYIENGASLPLYLCRDKIRNLIINERKNALIDRSEKRILDNARTNSYIRER